MNASVGIIGIGWVGASVAISALHAGVANELLLSDVRADVAEGEAMDLAHGASFYPAAQVRAADVEVPVHLHDRAGSLVDHQAPVREVGPELGRADGL